MPKELFKKHELALEGVKDDVTDRIVCIRVTHKRAPLSALESLSFTHSQPVMKEIASLPNVEECFVLQTCNRVEIYAIVSSVEAASNDDLGEFWLSKKDALRGDLRQLLEKSSGSSALLHLLKVASGLESMVVGEDQILGQLREAFKDGEKCGTVGPVLERILQFALRVGKTVRTATKINKGAVSMGSVGTGLLNNAIGNLTDKKILIVGAGHAGEMVGRALVSRKAGIIFVANRTYSRAVEMAKALNGRALHLDALEGHLVSADAVIVATSAPHYILTYPMMARVMEQRGGRPLVVVDLGEPRNVERTIARLPGLLLRDIDDLRDISRSGIEMRAREIRRAEKIIDQSLGQLLLMLKQTRVEPVISALYRKAEETRQREVGKAFAKMHLKVDERSKKGNLEYASVVEDLSKSLVDGVLQDLITNLRRSSASDDPQSLLVIKKLFASR